MTDVNFKPLFEYLDDKFGQIDQQFGRVDQRLTNLETSVDNLTQTVKIIHDEHIILRKRVDVLEAAN